MAIERISIPKSVLGGLHLEDGDVVEGTAHEDSVEIRVVHRAAAERRGMTAEEFVAKWLGQFPDIAEGTDPRLTALLGKHVRPK